MLPPIVVVVVAVVGVLLAIAMFFAGFRYRRYTAEQLIGSAEEEATKIVNDAIKDAEQKFKEVSVEAKEQAHQYKQDAEQEIKDRRNEVARQERRIEQKEENLDKKTASIEKKEDELKNKNQQADRRLSEVDKLRNEQVDKLESIASLTEQEAKEMLLTQIDQKLTHEKASRLVAYETSLKDEADDMARELISQAIARCAADHSSESTVSVVPLPNDEMKGRIIGREGRNIRALETATGVDLIIDDTPEAITLSSFDPVRREMARQALEKLIADGRIHPARIEETVEKSRRDLELVIKREGEKAVMDIGLHGVHPDLIKLIGRLRYRTSYGQNVLDHSIEVSYLSGILAAELGLNVTQAKRAGLLHDIGKALDHEIEGSHIQIGVDIAKRYKENPAIIHAIEAHHGDVEPETPLAFVVMAADAISAARPGARRENIESYIKRLETLEAIAKDFNGVESSFAIQAGREVRIMVKPEQISDDELVLLAHEISERIEEELDYPGQIKVNVMRESRAIDYAK